MIKEISKPLLVGWLVILGFATVGFAFNYIYEHFPVVLGWGLIVIIPNAFALMIGGMIVHGAYIPPQEVVEVVQPEYTLYETWFDNGKD